jgi:ribosomal protein S18 acetylase RimI-like enzyme
LTILELTTDDWTTWRDVRIAALGEAPHAFRSRLADWDTGGERRWRDRLASPDCYNIVAMLDETTVGVACGVREDDTTCAVRSVWVSPLARGRGVGDTLLAAVEAWAQRSGATTLTLEVLRGNEPAVALYERHGFADTGRSAEDDAREQVMSKPLP